MAVNLAQKYVKKMTSYRPPLDGRVEYKGTLLDFNERVSPLPPQIKNVIKEFAEYPFQVYPEYGDIQKVIARYVRVKEKQVLPTNGSDQAIDVVFRVFVKKGSEVIIPVPTFALLEQAARKQNCTIKRINHVGSQFDYPINEVLANIKKKTKLVVVCNPNNPTGTLASLDDIKKIAEAMPNGIVLVDEAYYEFSGLTAAGLIETHPNIVITRTMSKAFGLPTLRFGFIIASEEHIAECAKMRDPYDINTLAVTVARAALNAPAYATQYAKNVMTKSKPMMEKFFQDNGIPFVSSSANFILFKPLVKPERVFQILKVNGILIRVQRQKGLESWIRVSVGRVPDTLKFISIYKSKVLKQKQLIAFLDRDGTLIFEPQDTFQIDSLKKLSLLQDVEKGLLRLQREGFELVMITNQDGLGTKAYPQKKFDKVQRELMRQLAEKGITFREVLVCPHKEEDGCECRKPKTGLLTDFLKTCNVDTKQSFVCGDRESDRKLAEALGVKYQPIKTNGNFYNAIKSALPPQINLRSKVTQDAKAT